MKVGICNVGVGAGHSNGSRRLKESLDHHGIKWEQFFWIDKYPQGSPTHKEAPYGFKCYAMEEVKKAGYDIVVWADSAVWAINGNVEDLVKHVEREGYYFPNSGYSCGEWSSDVSLKALGFERNDDIHNPATSPMVMCCFTLLDLRQPKVREFYEEYQFWCRKDNGALLHGKHINDGSVSLDPRVKGHRHDQTYWSLLAKKYGFKVTNSHENYFQYYPYKDYVGHDWKTIDNSKILKSINFLTQGMR